MTLVDFLLARIAEDEAAARAASELVYDFMDFAAHILSSERDATPAMDEHVARWDPARILAECGAKRRIVEAESGSYTFRADSADVTAVMRRGPGGPDEVEVSFRGFPSERMSNAEFRDRYMVPSPPSLTLRLLAAVYADHPDYDESWRA